MSLGAFGSIDGAAVAAEDAAGASRRRRRGRAARPVSDINVTPFVDVMMVLLVVFMVAAPLLTVGVPLQLPRTAAAALPIDRQDPLTINIDVEGRLFLQRDPVEFSDLLPALSRLSQELQTDRVYLRADAGLDYGRVAEVMGALNAGGFRNIGLVTDPASGGGRPASAFTPAQ
ncbi:biopolymer transporter ExbD [Rubrimonas cliftonensis]|uniref:Cell division and transport-associated protein TolR n=1 Tax=Rubrimonas cliftonensis TaxID=89524 RepID=A0A1H4BXM9_9RHOB|nr:biopolymer transporter ExbD [Rubrimonas cliftonensis]SEA52817.1 Cell division and transport-associated protein TolR [Rubrimonas cliftonensis]